jgi:hypothetical protein
MHDTSVQAPFGICAIGLIICTISRKAEGGALGGISVDILFG